jgi:predicted site-specific integrase-resolvase
MSDDTKTAETLRIDAPLSHDAIEVMTKIQAAGFIQVSKRTLDNHMKRGWIPFIKLPSGAIRFRRSQLIAFLETYQRVSIS